MLSLCLSLLTRIELRAHPTLVCPHVNSTNYICKDLFSKEVHINRLIFFGEHNSTIPDGIFSETLPINIFLCFETRLLTSYKRMVYSKFHHCDTTLTSLSSTEGCSSVEVEWSLFLEHFTSAVSLVVYYNAYV